MLHVTIEFNQDGHVFGLARDVPELPSPGSKVTLNKRDYIINSVPPEWDWNMPAMWDSGYVNVKIYADKV